MGRFRWDSVPFGFSKKASFCTLLISVLCSVQLVWGVGYVEQYLNSPEICPPISSGFFSQHLNFKQKIRLVNFPNYTMSVKLSRWQERNTPSAHLNFRCTFEVIAPKGYGVMVTVRSLHLRRYSGPLPCRDFLRFKQKDSKISTDVCGEVSSSDKSEYPEDLTGPRYFYDSKAEMIVSIQTEDTLSQETNKPLTIELIFTAYHHCTPGELAEGQVKPCSRTAQDSCIDANLFCDGYVNCGLDEFGIDEAECEDKTGVSRSTTLVIFALTAVGTLIVAAVCIFVTCCCCRRCGKRPVVASPSTQQPRTSSSAGLNVPRPVSPTAPTSELTEMPVWRANTPTAPKAEVEDDDLPPSYKDLFPMNQAVIMR